MKEQGKDFDQSKEPVKGETVKSIVGECHKVFDVSLPLLEWDFPAERKVRIVYKENKEQASVFKRGGFSTRVNGSLIPGTRSRSYDIDFIVRNAGNNTFSIMLTEDLKSKKLIDWDDYAQEGEKLTYMYVVDFNSDNSFMQLYFSGPTFSVDMDRGPRHFSYLQSKRAEDILGQTFPAEPGKKYVFTHDVCIHPLANPVVPSEPLANNLLEFMKGIIKVSRFVPSTAF